MRVRHVLLGLCISLLTQIATAEEEELPPLELLGFIADFSDDEEGWVDPQDLEELFSLGGEPPESTEDSTAPGTAGPDPATDSPATDSAATGRAVGDDTVTGAPATNSNTGQY